MVLNKKRKDLMFQSISNEINAIKNRLNDYDWEYRLKRYEEKIQHEYKQVTDKLNKINLSD